VKNVLFICVENSCRSQMAEAFGKMLGQGVIESFSCGSHPSGVVNPKATESMSAVGYDLQSHYSKSLDAIPGTGFEMVVTMGCGEECPLVDAAKREDWDIPDPKGMEAAQFDQVRDDIRGRVVRLVSRLNPHP
jgi:arsenate reductase